MELRTQTLIWHNMESQIHWTDETDYAWFSKMYLAKLKSSCYGELGYFVCNKNMEDILFMGKDGIQYTLDEIVEFAEL